ncbi:hypothetical protein N824_02300 [Pedobacter sp. V48]|nr:hypothetical protein N824_02300 [Pedobacter sp. V48]
MKSIFPNLSQKDKPALQMQDTVLIIDDEKKLCNLMARVIELESFKVFQAYTGKDGLKILKTERFKWY